MKPYTKHPAIHLTFDVEETPSFTENRHDRDHCALSNEGCAILMDLLHACEVKATFFITGYFAERKPDIVKQLHDHGHEIASHSYRHHDIKDLDTSRLTSEIQKSTAILSRITGESISGFRAPFCRYRKDLRAILKMDNYQYDSSLHPAVVPGKYWNLFSPLSPFQDDNGIWEIPISVIPVVRFPISWWWMRNLGPWITYSGTTINLSFQRNAVLYFHPWEFTDLPKTRGTPFHITRNTGTLFCKRLKNFIHFYKDKAIAFVPIKERIPPKHIR